MYSAQRNSYQLNYWKDAGVQHQPYWNRSSTSRLTRRRALKTGGGAALARRFSRPVVAAAGKKRRLKKEKTSSLVTKAADTSKDAKRGGVLKLSASGEPQNWDPHGLTSSTAALTEMMYSRLGAD